MSRVISSPIIFLFILLCYDVLADLSVEDGGLEDSEDGSGSGAGGNEKMQLMGFDYYNGGKVATQEEYFDYDNIHLKTENALLSSHHVQDQEKNIEILDSKETRNYRAEISAGNKADILGTNPDSYQAFNYPDFSRRFVLQYPYTEKGKKTKEEVISKDGLTPTLASPEFVLAVAKKSLFLDAAAPNHIDENIRKDILRTGDYWNGVWKEDADPRVLRSAKKLETIKAEIPPGTKLYDLVLKLKRLSPTLLYVINEKKK